MERSALWNTSGWSKTLKLSKLKQSTTYQNSENWFLLWFRKMGFHFSILGYFGWNFQIKEQLKLRTKEPEIKINLLKKRTNITKNNIILFGTLRCIVLQ